MPPISSLGSAPRITLSSPAASTAAIQSRKSLFATIVSLAYDHVVMAGLVPAIPIRKALRPRSRSPGQARR